MGKNGREEGMGHYTWIITPANTGSEGRCPMGGGGSIWISGRRGPCSDSGGVGVEGTCKGEGRWIDKR